MHNLVVSKEYYNVYLLVDELYRFHNMSILDIEPIGIACIVVLSWMDTSLKRDDNLYFKRSEALIKEAGGIRIALDALFTMYTTRFLEPAARKAEQLLLDDGFSRLTPGWSFGEGANLQAAQVEEKRQQGGAFGKWIHVALRDSNVVSMEFFMRENSSKEFVSIVRFGIASEGAPAWVHGGVISCVCDMFLARSSLHLFGSSVTKNFVTRFRSPVPLLSIVSLRLLKESTPGSMRAQAVDEDGVLCFECEGSFFVPKL